MEELKVLPQQELLKRLNANASPCAAIFRRHGVRASVSTRGIVEVDSTYFPQGLIEWTKNSIAARDEIKSTFGSFKSEDGKHFDGCDFLYIV